MSFLNNIDRRVKIAGLIITGVVVIAGTWYLGSPLFINNRVDEAFPVAQTAMPKEEAGAMADEKAMPTKAVTQTDASKQQAAMSMSDSMTKTDSTDAMHTADAMTQPETPDMPTAISQGSFTEVDNIHKGAGNATLYQLPNGKRVLRLENFNVTNGPDLFIYLAGSVMPRNSSDLHSAGAFEVARLKGNVGDQNYELPADLDLAQFKSVVIYCKQFSVVFSTADLMSAG